KPGKDYFYYFTLKPNETKTFTVGFRCDSDMIENAYFNLDEDGVSAVKITPSGAMVDKVTNIYYSVKVKE
ncbi:MAG: hypothetical protein J1E41_07615, partial [Ruminococcus sp.]|nr:hypothetical protein [Ruminococcus sp.]